jgi:hypothetical protein
MSRRYSQWAGPLTEIGRFEWERVIKKCTFKQQSTKLVALLLATYASEDGTSVRPGRERLSIVAGLSPKHVSTQLGKLEDLGLIFKVHNGSSYGRRGGLASVYSLTVPSTLYELYQEDPSEVEQLWHEAAWTVFSEQQGNPSSHVSEEQVNSGSHVREQKTQEHVNSEPEQGNSEAEHVNSESEHVNPSSPHQSLTPLKKHHPKEINQSLCITEADTHARENALAERPSIEDERSRQLAALEKLPNFKDHLTCTEARTLADKLHDMADQLEARQEASK